MIVTKIAFDANVIKSEEHNFYSNFLDFIEYIVDEEIENKSSWLETIVGSAFNA